MDEVLQFSKQIEYVACNVSLAESLQSHLLECWKSSKFCDVKVCIKDKTFLAHKFVLSMMSEYLRGVFQHSVADTDEIKLPDNIDAEAFECILRFAYTGKLEINNGNVERLVVATDYLQVNTLKTFCGSMLMEVCAADNVMRLFVISDLYNLTELKEKCSLVLYRDFCTIYKSKEYLQLEVEFVQAILNNKMPIRIYETKQHLTPLSSTKVEEIFFTATLNYISHNYDEYDLSKLVNLFKYIKLPFLDFAFMNEELLKFTNIRNNNGILSMMKLSQSSTSYDYAHLCWEQRDQSYSSQFESSPYLADTGQVGYDGLENHESSIDPFLYPSKITLYSRSWDGREVLGGVHVLYNNDQTVEYGMKNGSLQMENTYVVELTDGEVITEVLVASGYLIDSLKFTTNFGKVYGPFGGDGGSKHVLKPDDKMSYLHSFPCESVITQSARAIIHFSIQWVKII